MFDRYFADQAPGWRRRGLMVASLVLHGLFGLAVLAWSWSQVTDTAPEVPLTFFAPPPPPPPKASSPARKTRPKVKVTRPAMTTMLVRYNPKPDRPEPTVETNDDGQEGGAAGGVKGGTVGGTGKVVPQFIADRQRLAAPDPHLPEWFRQQHPRETVKGTYLICVNTDGRIVDVRVVNGIAGVDRVIVDQIRAGWTYKPQPLPFCSNRVFNFEIN